METPITPEDVERFLSGELPEEANRQRIAEAIEKDPQIARWAELLDFERFIPAEPAASAPPAWLLKSIKQAQQATLASLVLEQPPKRLLEGEEAISGQAVLMTDHGEQTIKLELRRSGDEPPAFQLIAPDWPKGCEPISVLLGQFASPAYPTTSSRGRWNELPCAARRKEITTEPDLWKTDSVLSADSIVQKGVRGESADRKLKWLFEGIEKTGTFSMHAELPEGCDGDFLVVELEYQSVDGMKRLRKVVHLATRLPKDNWWGGTVNFTPPDDAVGDRISIVVRPLSQTDLHLLNTEQVTEFLGTHKFEIMSATPSKGGFAFQASWDDQQTLAKNGETCWCLQLATHDMEG